EWRAIARRALRLPARPGVQQFLSRIPGAIGIRPRKENLPVVDDGLFPVATGANAGRAGHRSAGIYVAVFRFATTGGPMVNWPTTVFVPTRSRTLRWAPSSAPVSIRAVPVLPWSAPDPGFRPRK